LDSRAARASTEYPGLTRLPYLSRFTIFGRPAFEEPLHHVRDELDRHCADLFISDLIKNSCRLSRDSMACAAEHRYGARQVSLENHDVVGIESRRAEQTYVGGRVR